MSERRAKLREFEKEELEALQEQIVARKSEQCWRQCRLSCNTNLCVLCASLELIIGLTVLVYGTYWLVDDYAPRWAAIGAICAGALAVSTCLLAFLGICSASETITSTNRFLCANVALTMSSNLGVLLILVECSFAGTLLVEKNKIAGSAEAIAEQSSGSPLAKLDLLSTGLMGYTLLGASGLALLRSAAGWQVAARREEGVAYKALLSQANEVEEEILDVEKLEKRESVKMKYAARKKQNHERWGKSGFCLKVQFMGHHQQSKAEGGHVTFLLQVSDAMGCCWETRRRYSEFDTLWKQIRKDCQAVQARLDAEAKAGGKPSTFRSTRKLVFPRKSVRALGASAMKRRQDALQQLVEQLLEPTLHTKLDGASSSLIRMFLQCPGEEGGEKADFSRGGAGAGGGGMKKRQRRPRMRQGWRRGWHVRQ
jgi:hypothetical protein